MVDLCFVVIGAGSIGKRHAENLQTLGQRVDLIRYRDCDADTLANRADIIGMVIATATPIRMELIALCAAQGWPFYVEKPLGWTTAQIADLYEAAAPVADRSMIGFMMRYHPAVRTLAARDLSDVYRFAFEIGHDVRQWRANWSFADSYAAQAEGGGVLLDLCHELDIANCLFPGLTVSQSRCLSHANFPGVDFATTVTVTAPNGATGTVAMDYLSPVSLRKAQLRGTQYTIDLDLLGPAVTINDGHTPHTETYAFIRNDMFLNIMRDFIALATGKDPSDNPLLPRFDRTRASCDLIAAAWEARIFDGNVAVDFS